MNSVHGILTPKDQDRLRRLFSRMLGQNFKLAIVETRLPMQSEKVIEWFGEQLPQAHFFEVDLGKLSGPNLWSALTEHLAWSDIPENAILIFYGLENAMGGILDRPDIFQQLNVQRDLFVRDFPVPWLFFVHPESRQELNRVAPDFCDFAAVWVETTAKHGDKPGYQTELFNPELAIFPDLGNYLTHPLLKAAWSAFQQRRFFLAQDLLSRFDLCDNYSVHEGKQREFLQIRDLYRQGRSDKGHKLLKAMLEGNPYFDGSMLKRSYFQWEEIIDALVEVQISEGSPSGDVAMHSVEEAEIQTLFSEMFSRVEGLLDKGNDAGALEDAQALLVFAQELEDKTNLKSIFRAGIANFQLGRVLFIIGDTEHALQFLAESLRYFDTLVGQEDPDVFSLAANVLSLMGDCYYYLSRMDDAKMAIEDCIQRYGKMGNRAGLAAGLSRLGDVWLFQRVYSEAIGAFLDAKDILEEIGDCPSLALVWLRIGNAYGYVGDVEQAIASFQEALLLNRGMQNTMGEATVLNELAGLYIINGQLNEARKLFHQACEIFGKIGESADLGRVMGNLANTLVKQELYEDARKALSSSFEWLLPFARKDEFWKAYRLLYILEKAEGREGEAQAAREKAISHYIAYRRDGGVNHSDNGKLCSKFSHDYASGKREELRDFLTATLNDENNSDSYKALAKILLSIYDGLRDLSLTQNPELELVDAAELRMILEGLES